MRIHLIDMPRFNPFRSATAPQAREARREPRACQHNAGPRRLLPLALAGLLAASACSAPGPRATAPRQAGRGEPGARFQPTAAERERLDRLHEALAGSPQELLAETPRAGELMVRLAFDAAADLDLFVTDPQQESIYFANSPSRSGGRLLADRRCQDEAPRVEAVHYPSPPSGRYRVGVDFHALCEDSGLSRRASKRGLYVVRVDLENRSLLREGVVLPGRFEVIVLEFEVSP